MHSPELALWRAVILQAMADAERPARPVTKGPSGKRGEYTAQERLARLEAIDWWKRPRSADFKLVCEYAGLEPDVVYDSFINRPREGVRARKYLGG